MKIQYFEDAGSKTVGIREPGTHDQGSRDSELQVHGDGADLISISLHGMLWSQACAMIYQSKHSW